MPVFIHHTLEDKIIPFEQGRTLYELAGTPKHFEQGHGYHCQHSYSFFVALQQFLNESAGLNLRPPHKPIGAVVAATLASEGVENAVMQYRELRAHRAGNEYNFAEYELNWLGRGVGSGVCRSTIPACEELQHTRSTIASFHWLSVHFSCWASAQVGREGFTGAVHADPQARESSIE